MALSIFLVCFLLAATYFQAIQGLTSAVIMAVLTALCVGLAFGTYEAVAAATLISVTPDYAHAIAFFGMFLIPLIVLRVALDSLVPRSNLCHTCSTGQPRAWWVSSPRF
jgi:membrane protein CcdC involved in cytochrome C biogenesis